ncbi:ABC transporter-related protein [Chloroherpeton thalassium ATCC 35110]|uniref:ABC transporter-related protein n=1 Tax=Chloroherpeton thalassium (strain ATCC 35110 / GB-78) TaxID=517418 RepID=B3QTW5_CHLT3|nr:ABC-F family ATP-binding cassette domain-containing protein [Chloroherpeton thalassium]ACF14313.1 ABC transporter-related protein [Chloroherpeton thalassium ATCC 35110]
MTVFTVENIGKHFGVKRLFENVSFGIDEKDKVGLIGVNGSGKTTLLRIIAGLEPPDTGKVMISNQKVISFLPQDAPFNPDDTVLEAILRSSNKVMNLIYEYELVCSELEKSGGTDEGLVHKMSELSNDIEIAGAWEIEANARTVLSKLGIHDTDRKMGLLSGGQRKRVALAHALLAPADLLILDEPTNHLDADTVTWLENYLQRFTGAVLLVTHDRYFLDRVTNRMIELDGISSKTFTGGYSSYLLQKQELEEREAVMEKKRNALIKNEIEWLRTGCKARTTKQKARIERAEEMMAAPKKQSQKELDIDFKAGRLGKKIIEFHKVSKSYGEKTLVKDFEYLLQKGDKLGIIGANGSGKTTLLEMVMGKIAPDSGHIDTGETVCIGYYDQESRDLDESKRVIEYIREEAEHIKAGDGTLISAGKMLERFLFTPNAQYSYIGTLSGGERRRLYLLRQLMKSPNVLILDEPTNDLDIPTLIALEDYLDSFSGCLIIVSHDRYFLDRTVEHIFAFEGEGKIKEYPGNYSLYLELKARQTSEENAKSEKKEKPKTAPKPNNNPRKLSYKEKRELEQLEKDIAAAEERQSEIETALGEVGSDFEKMQALTEELHQLTETLEQKMERWAELAELA